ncbi:hypothetical protein JB92DRAFT_2817469 [Gautieria morchelliformis]|nr:hypothetical protein JB92DRAFT_2817469 [Gautieria morchelliformis]
MEHQVPRFLHHASRDPNSSPGSYSGLFTHTVFETDIDAHVRWWPCMSTEVRTVVLFIPGNPGLIDFYTPFLSALHDTFQHDGLAILAHAHLGHTPHVKVLKTMSLLHQVEAVLETFDEIRACWPDIKVIIVGHSVGSWIATQVLQRRSNDVDALFLLFPTISNIAQTPNGRQLSWFFNTPIASVISRLSVLIRPISAPVLSVLFPSWPPHQKAVLHSLLSSPRAIFSCLTMASDEMRVITAPNISCLQDHSSKLWLFYAAKDDWVGKERETITEVLGDPAAFRIVHDKHRVPHAFCILHGEIVATQCANWLRHGGFIQGQVDIDI